jgi:hypothetical protein
MEDRAVVRLFDVLYSDINDEEEFYNRKPLLAHYTSLEGLENILKTNELWLFNPLFMNDLEEVRFGIVHGAQRIKEHEDILKALRSSNLPKEGWPFHRQSITT